MNAPQSYGETLLARQLQQAWLEAQVRKQTPDISSSPPNHGPLTSSSAASYSSSSASPDAGAGALPDSAPSTAPLAIDDEKTLHDPMLQVISDMLMDGDLEDRPCMYAEGVSYMKGLYDMIGSNDAPFCPDYIAGSVKDEILTPLTFEESSTVIEEDTNPDSDFLGSSASFDDVNLDAVIDGLEHREVPEANYQRSGVDLYAHVIEASKSLTTTEQSSIVSSVKAKNVLTLNKDEHEWIDDLLSNMDAITSTEDASAGTVLSSAASVTSYNGFHTANFSPQHHTGSNTVYPQDPLLDWVSLSPGSVVTEVAPNSEEKHHNVQFTSNLRKSSNVIAGSNKQMHSHARPFERSSSVTSQNFPRRNASDIRLKRAAIELDSASASQNDFLPASNSVTLDDLGEESVSFVQNKHLNAEKYASILNGGLSAVNGACCKSSSTSSQVGVGKSSTIVSTVADLNGLLTSCAQAVASNNLRRAQEILREIRQDSSPYGSGLQRLAHYFAEGLVARISGTGGRLYSVFTSHGPSAAKMMRAHQLFVEVSPFVKVSYYFANRAILEAAKGISRLHIIDYGILYGLQWPYLISALAERKGGPPVLRITGIDFPQPGYARAERVEMTGQRLKEYAKTYGVPFEYCSVADRWETVQASSLSLRQDELVIVNSICRMHNLLDETVLASNPRKTVLNKINKINPKIFVLGVKNGNCNAPFFMSRFKEALNFFSGFFDMLETLINPDNQERMMIEKELLGRDILNVVACEGPERIERPETFRQWQNRAQNAGFVQLAPGQKVLSESQTIVKCDYNKNFTVDKDGSWMLLSWKGKVVNGLSLWKPAGN